MGGTRLICFDFTKAFLCGCVDRDVNRELPDEDARKKRGLVARPHKAMCGLRDMATGVSRHDEETRSPCTHSGAMCVLSPGRGE